ncbi:similar to glycine cleavage system H protein [Cyanidioschyzon merolae strain 10D]|jgi:glycine cleavage system H protein|uniref:Glycine cleavage system H protein n=1 Tax=Cyanidioschyzon merolae (strain NIES-3377 / 10D) TaxID=280699 RepID=M1VFW1_CYAM1|nr:similar to glycine cleavage system H protein [Cyanidioschyzon merolae strain 10D]BAM79473.1 similar to glycine cleavage system H protein [Cyanidioschyzon merolae strain 10D]|eukprot:XP_005535759.1 similar to glycine cleavage system H protein [Cyanidioschyzon merolae strain 10D]
MNRVLVRCMTASWPSALRQRTPSLFRRVAGPAGELVQMAPQAAHDRGRRLLASAAGTFPADRKYMKSHEWVKVENGTGTVGITSHAASQLGDIVFVDLPAIGSQLEKGATFGAVESVKAASDVYSPVSGEVVEVNAVLSEDPAQVNKDPHDAGWMIKVRVSNADELQDLMDAKAYEEHVASEHH